jgi:Kef-type K+ transport system membrane component KefB/mannitol/fructose-specific phosphotransferase system IIA component (Ntr-type)
MHYLDESHILVFLLQVSLLLGLARTAGLLLRRVGQPAITGEILVGILLGPTIFGRFWPGLHGAIFPADMTQQNMLETVAWLGIMFFLLETGLETDLAAAWRQRREALVIAFSDLILPMALAFAFAMLLPERYVGGSGNRIFFSLFIGTIMTISALPVTARILQELDIYRSDAGLLTISALTVNDIAGWVVFAVILGFATGDGMSVARAPLILAGTVAFVAASLTLGKRLTDHALCLIERLKLPQAGTSLTLIWVLGMLGGAITILIGVHALFGFFIVGVMAGESRHLSEKTRQTISQMVRAVLVPLFFASIGLKIDFLSELDVRLAALMLVIGVGGRFLGAWIGVSLTRYPRTSRHLISAGHTPGGEMQIVIGILALEYGVITPVVFVAIVLSAVLSSVILGPWMKLALKRGRRVKQVVSLGPGQVVPAIAAKSRDDVIRRLAEAAASGGGLDGEAVARAALERENIMGTAVGEGVAIPHARLVELATPRLVFGRVPAGVEWNAPDGAPVQLAFLILTPASEDASQLEILRAVAGAMHRPENREALLAASESDLGRVATQMLKAS